MTKRTYSKINFQALADAYTINQLKYDINILFANVASYSYWHKVWNYQNDGIKTAFVMNNILACCESSSYVENRLNSLSHKIIRSAINVNTLLHRSNLRGFLTQKFEKTDEGVYFKWDAQRLAEDIADQYYENTGSEITETNWFVKADRLR